MIMSRIETILANTFESVHKVSHKSYHAEMMQYYEEVLSQAARNYAFTSDKKWEQRYIEFEKLSDKLLKDAIKKADSSDKEFFFKMDVSNQKLVKMEYLAIDFVNDNKSKHAIEFLESEEYLQERKVLAGGLETFVKEHIEKESDSWIVSKPIKEIVELERRLAILEQDLKNDKFIIIGTLTSRLSHDLRNPLSIIKISLENIKMMYGNKIQIKQFEKIERAINRITHQVDNVLDFVREQPLELNKTKFSEIVAEAIDSLIVPNNIKMFLPKKDVELLCDKRQFSIAMNNLIFNSIQAIDGVGTIIISFEENKDTIVIEVEDSGKGIPKEKMDKIFDPLFTTKQTGTGLGLASVKSIIESHDGTISVTSSPTIFTITLPKISD